jgi:hypothetical protein
VKKEIIENKSAYISNLDFECSLTHHDTNEAPLGTNQIVIPTGLISESIYKKG